MFGANNFYFNIPSALVACITAPFFCCSKTPNRLSAASSGDNLEYLQYPTLEDLAKEGPPSKAKASEAGSPPGDAGDKLLEAGQPETVSPTLKLKDIVGILTKNAVIRPNVVIRPGIIKDESKVNHLIATMQKILQEHQEQNAKEKEREMQDAISSDIKVAVNPDSTERQVLKEYQAKVRQSKLVVSRLLPRIKQQMRLAYKRQATKQALMTLLNVTPLSYPSELESTNIDEAIANIEEKERTLEAELAEALEEEEEEEDSSEDSKESIPV